METETGRGIGKGRCEGRCRGLGDRKFWVEEGTGSGRFKSRTRSEESVGDGWRPDHPYSTISE